MVGIGFAFVENILYLAAAYNGTDGMGPGGTEALATHLPGPRRGQPLRPPAVHRLHRHRRGHRGDQPQPVGARRRPRRWATVAAVLAHATWNASTLFGARGFLGTYVVVMVPVLASVMAFAVWSRRSERRMLTAALADAAAARTVAGHRHRLGRRPDRHGAAAGRGPGRPGGADAERAMRDYQQAAVELGFLHHRYLRGTPPPDFAARGQAYVARIAAARPSISFPGQVVPTR